MLALTLLVAAGCPRPQAPPAASAPPGPIAPPSVTPAAASTAAAATWGCVYQGQGGVYWLPLDEGAQPVKLRSLQADDSVSSSDISDDGVRLALIISNGAGEIIDVAGAKTQTVLFSGDTNATTLAWSPDAAAIAYTFQGKLYVYRGGTRQVLVPDKRVTSIAWAPDGKQIAYGRRDSKDSDLGLFVIPAAGGKARQFVPGTRDVAGVSDIAWSPNDKTIAFLHAWEGGALCFIKADGTGYRAEVGPAFGQATWLQDSSAVVYTATDNEVETLGIYRCTPGGKPEPIVRNKAASYDMLPTGLLLVCQGTSDNEPNQPVKIAVKSRPSQGAPSTWSGRVEGSSYAEGRLCPDGQAMAILARDETGDGALSLARIGEDLSQRTTKVERILGWVKR